MMLVTIYRKKIWLCQCIYPFQTPVYIETLQLVKNSRLTENVGSTESGGTAITCSIKLNYAK